MVIVVVVRLALVIRVAVMNSVQCINCCHLNLKAADRMAYQGCGVCIHDVPCTYYSAKAERHCNLFEQTTKEIVDKRVVWLRARNGNQ